MVSNQLAATVGHDDRGRGGRSASAFRFQKLEIECAGVRTQMLCARPSLHHDVDVWVGRGCDIHDALPAVLGTAHDPTPLG